MQISPKQWDGLLLISSASRCQTEIDISVNDKEESTMDLIELVLIWQKMFFNYMVLTAKVKRPGSGAHPEVNG
jgi:hypothetical protein